MVNILRPDINHNLDFARIEKLRRDSNPLTYKRYEEINENEFSIKLRDLKVSEKVSIFRQSGFFMYIENENSFTVNIVSKNSNSSIQKKIIFKQDRDYNYFKNKRHNKTE